MNKSQAKERIDKLIRQIDELRYSYHVLNDPTISDQVYDSLQQELRELEEKFPDLKRLDSPLQRIGGRPLDKFEKVRHVVRQWSFNDAFSQDEVVDWEKRIKKILIKEQGREPKLDYVCELKIDGLHVVFTYKKGVLELAATRGDGVVGENVTANIKTIQSVPLKIKQPLGIIVEGEVWLSEKQLAEINKERVRLNLPEFANPRNAAAGTIRQLDPKIVAARKLDCFVYDWSGGTAPMPPTQFEELVALKDLGFKVNSYYQLCKNVSEVVAFWQKWQKERKSQPYWIDGIVVKVNQRKYQEALGYVGKAPRWVIAFKFPAEEVTTVIEAITVQVGRLGTLTPVANLRPVKLGGTIVKRATLHNVDQIRKIGVKIGDTAVIRKAGEIIPEVVAVMPKMRTGKEKEFKMPSKCPICGSAVRRKEITEKGQSESVAFFCSNKNCYAQQSRRLMHFVSKKAFNIEGLGEKIIEQLVEENLIKDPADIFTITQDDLIPLERFASKSADNLVQAIKERKNIPFSRFLYALGIGHVGEETAIDLAAKFNNLGNLKKATLQDLMQITDIGPVVAKGVWQYFSGKKNLALLAKLEKVGVKIQEEIFKAAGPLQGKKIVVTGVLETMSRDEAKDAVRRAGGDFVSAVSRNTDYVVAGENPGSKYNKAKLFGVRIINEKEFLNLVK